MNKTVHSDTPGISASGVMFALASLACWSGTPLLVFFFTDKLDVWTSNGVRYGMAAAMWLPFLIWSVAKGRVARSVWRRALIPAVFSTAAQVAFVAAFYQIDPGMLTFGLRLQIVVAAVGAAMLFPGERTIVRRPLFIMGGLAVLVGTVGVAGLSADGFGDKSTVVGVLLAMAAGAGYACYALAVRKCMAGVSSRLAFSVISLYVGAALLVLMVLFGERSAASLGQLDSGDWGLLVLSVIVGLAAGHVIYFEAMERLGVAPSTGIIQLQPFTVAIASYFVFGELLNLPQIACGLVAVAGAMMMIWTQYAIAKRRGIDPQRAFDELPTNPTLAAEEAERAGDATDIES